MVHQILQLNYHAAMVVLSLKAIAEQSIYLTKNNCLKSLFRKYSHKIDIFHVMLLPC